MIITELPSVKKLILEHFDLQVPFLDVNDQSMANEVARFLPCVSNLEKLKIKYVWRSNFYECLSRLSSKTTSLKIYSDYCDEADLIYYSIPDVVKANLKELKINGGGNTSALITQILVCSPMLERLTIVNGDISFAAKVVTQ